MFGIVFFSFFLLKTTLLYLSEGDLKVLCVSGTRWINHYSGKAPSLLGKMSHSHPAYQQEYITHESYPRSLCTSPLHKHWLICLIHTPANARGGTHDTALQPLLDSPQNPAGLMVLLPTLGKVLFQKSASKASRKGPQDGKVVSEGDPMWWNNSTMVFTVTQSMPCGIY